MLLQGKGEPAGIRRAAAVALGKIGAKAQVVWPAVKGGLKDPDRLVRYQAIRLAGGLAKDERSAVPALAESAAKDDTTENRLAAIQELGQLGPAAIDAVPTLTSLAASDSRGSIREAAEAALKKIKNS